jgi:hypothetical protein
LARDIGRRERVDPVRITAEVGHGLAHRGQVDDARHAREVLHDHPGRGELDLHGGHRIWVPVGERADVLGGDVLAVLRADQVLQQHLQRERQSGGILQAVDADDLEDLVFGVRDRERVPGGEAVLAGLGRHGDSPS